MENFVFTLLISFNVIVFCIQSKKIFEIYKSNRENRKKTKQTIQKRKLILNKEFQGVKKSI